MNFVEPIRDRKKIAQIKNLLRGQERIRDLLFVVASTLRCASPICWNYTSRIFWMSREKSGNAFGSMWVEAMFGDLKKPGFDLESTMLRHFLRLSRLTLAVVLCSTFGSFRSAVVPSGMACAMW